MQPTRTNHLLAHQRLDAWRVCCELSHEVHRLVRVMRTYGTKERRDLLKRTSVTAVRCVVAGASAYKAQEKVEQFAAARNAVALVASELEILVQEEALRRSAVGHALQLAGREVAMLTRLVAKFAALSSK